MQVTHNIFKNSGLRGKVEQDFITSDNMLILGYAIGYFFAKTFHRPINIIIATDTRSSGKWIKQQLVQGVANFGNHIFDAGIVPTPFIAKALKDYKLSTDNATFQLGIMITASHNPAEYNGVKIMTPQGYLDDKAEQSISELFKKYALHIDDLKDPINPNIQQINLVNFYTTETQKLIVTQQFKNLKVVIDCANGATYQVANHIFSSFGITTIPINNSNNGALINHKAGCIDPTKLKSVVQAHQADWGCAFDGDGDRITLVDHTGQIFDGDDILVVLSQHPLVQASSTFVGTIMNNLAIERYFTTAHKQFIRTDVGEKNLIEALIQHDALIGSEPCGHITVPKHALCSDGIFAALLFFDTMNIKNIKNIQIPTKFPQMHTTVKLNRHTIEEKTLQHLVQTYENVFKPGRVIIRKSNTEPVIRIMVEHPSTSQAKQILSFFAEQCIKICN